MSDWIQPAIEFFTHPSGIITGLVAVVYFSIQQFIIRANTNNSVAFAQRQREMSKIAADLIIFYQKTKGANIVDKIEEMQENKMDAKVACWFPDNVYQGYRDHVVALINDARGDPLPSDYWEAKIEILMQDVVKSVRRGSKILKRPPASPVCGDTAQIHYRFLPWIAPER